jgi:hypothetical protein
MVVMRVVSGTGMSFINSTVLDSQSEFSPKAGRGLYVCMQLSAVKSQLRRSARILDRLWLLAHGGSCEKLWNRQTRAVLMS